MRSMARRTLFAGVIIQTGISLHAISGETMTDTIEDLLENSRLLILEPDDVLVLEFPCRVTDADAQRIKARFAEYSSRKLLVLSDNAHFAVIREAS